VKLRSHLVLLVLGAVLPVLAFAAIMAGVFWRQQHAALDARSLERVRALAIALDREMEGHIRALEVLARTPSLRNGDLRAFAEHARQVRAEEPAWDALIIVDKTGQQLVNTRVPFGRPLPTSALDPKLFAQVVETGHPVVAPLVRGAVSQKLVTGFIVPVRDRAGIPFFLVADIDPRVWLELFAKYPMGPGSTITVVDQRGVITARTLSPERWIGQLPSPTLAEKVRAGGEGTFRNPGGLDGRAFHSAYARSSVAGWTVATGVPAEIVEGDIRASAIALTTGAVATALLAVALALWFGRRIARPVNALAESVRRFGTGEPVGPVTAPAVDEVREVALAFQDTAARLSAREAALRESQALAEAANRTKDEFLAVLSHELRTPINAVYGWARMLRERTMTPDQAARGLEVIERNAAAQVRLIEDLLDISRIVTGKMRLDVRMVDVAQAIDSALDAVRHAADVKELRLERLVDPRAGPVAGDADRLQQVVWNLLSNAIKFTPRRGRVQVRLARVNSHVEIVVADTGAGIDPVLLPHIFDRFRQGDSTSTRTHGGLGLGLALVKHIVELHGGTVHAISEGEGRGATFTVKLPVSLAATPAELAHPTVPRVAVAMPVVSLEKVRVLFVDDDRDTLDLFTRIAANTGAETRVATSVAEAIAIFTEWRPDVLVSDVEMPGQDGYALIAYVRALAPEHGGDVPAIAVTAYGRVEDRVRLVTAGYDVHVPKPVEPAELLAVLASRARRTGEVR
jgi:signal transduction histidine kinase/ActR/RegA family two-component response regulator